MSTTEKLSTVERRALLDMFAELSAVDPDEHRAGSPYHQLLLGTEIGALKKLLAAALVGDPAPKADVDVTGKMGFYSIQPVSRRGRAWVKRNLSGSERTVHHGAVMCEGGRNIRTIVSGMVKVGLRVDVNGERAEGGAS